MADVNRHLRGKTNEIEIDVHGKVVVEKGDFMVMFNTSSTLLSSYTETTADYYGYPVSYLRDVTDSYYANQFIGIAMLSSEAGVTEKIPIATTGIFRYPLTTVTGVTATHLVCGSTSAAKVAYDQQVVSRTRAQVSDICRNIFGTCVKTESGASTVDFMLHTRWSGVTIVDFGLSI